MWKVTKMEYQNYCNEIKNILEELNLKYNNLEIYYTAFRHKSYVNENGGQSNERLEYLGDAILDFLVAEYLYITYPNKHEGELTQLRRDFVLGKANSNYAIDLNLGRGLMLGRGEKITGGETKPTLLNNLFEAFLGAVYLDGGMKEVKKILEKYVFPKISNKSSYFVDYKSILQEQIQADNRESVKYEKIKETGPAHDKVFTMAVYHDDIQLGYGSGKSKREAEQQAAKAALEKLAK